MQVLPIMLFFTFRKTLRTIRPERKLEKKNKRLKRVVTIVGRLKPMTVQRDAAITSGRMTRPHEQPENTD